MTAHSDEDRPVKSFVCKALRHPFAWVLGGVALGTLSMYALGKVSDLEKVVWFAAGTAITATATVIQSHLSNIRAAQEREFNKSESIREHTTNVRLSAYENFLQCSTNSFQENFTDNTLAALVTAHARVRIVGNKEVADLSREIIDLVIEFKKSKSVDSAPVWFGNCPLSTRYGALIANITHAMGHALENQSRE